jgi:hypothetical protein
MIQDGVQGPIQFAQDWVGGGLSSILGMKYGKLPSAFSPFGTSGKLAKFGNMYVKNGLAANAWDFAYSDWDKYRKKSWGEHLALFAVGGATGSLFDASMKSSGYGFDGMNVWQKTGDYFLRGSNGIIAGIVGYGFDGWVKSGKFPYATGSQQNKAEQMSFKWLLQLIKI